MWLATVLSSSWDAASCEADFLWKLGSRQVSRWYKPLPVVPAMSQCICSGCHLSSLGHLSAAAMVGVLQLSFTRVDQHVDGQGEAGLISLPVTSMREPKAGGFLQGSSTAQRKPIAGRL